MNNRINEVRTLQCKKQIRIQSGSAFSLSTNYIVTDSGRLMPPRINIRRDVPLAAHVEIIRPPLHHFHSRFQMLRLMYICSPHAVALLVAHLALDGVLRPRSGCYRPSCGSHGRTLRFWCRSHPTCT